MVERKEMIKISEIAKEWEQCEPPDKIANDCSLCPFGTRVHVGQMKVPICVMFSLIRGNYPEKK